MKRLLLFLGGVAQDAYATGRWHHKSFSEQHFPEQRVLSVRVQFLARQLATWVRGGFCLGGLAIEQRCGLSAGGPRLPRANGRAPDSLEPSIG